MPAPCLQSLPFELVYLAQLTRQGLKPLSRWEKEFGPETTRALHGAGLKTRTIRRHVHTGQTVLELLFSRSDQCLELYAARFEGRAVERNRNAMRIEGRLFGYPACCVESYAARGYARNELSRADQGLLFHWACPHCRLTPLLLPHYRRIHEQSRTGRAHGFSPARLPKLERSVRSHLMKAVAVAASLAGLGSGLAAPSQSVPYPDDHHLFLSVWEDPDADLLASWEEIILGYDPEEPDENNNGVPDGVEIAHQLSLAIDELPEKPVPGAPFVEHHLTFGLETCEVCGELYNMGFLEVVHPLENQSIPIPYVAKHYLDHGSFSFAGSEHTGRLNPALLHLLLTGQGLGHFLAEPSGTDLDNDGLQDWEEAPLGTDPVLPDTDGDLLRDGIDVARSLLAQLQGLPQFGRPEDGPKDRPFVVTHPMDGIETCPRCGERVVMDIWDVIHPVSGQVISIPSMALHYLSHGGCRWSGGQLMGGQGRVDPRHLWAVLTGQGNGHWLHVAPDTDGDLLTDREEVDLGTHPLLPDENQNDIPDGPELAQAVSAEIEALPTQPTPDQVYRLDFPLRGLERCDICGQEVNMGELTVCNPRAGLYAKLPYLSLHYLEHGSFSYAGNVHGNARPAVTLLVDTLHSTGPRHVNPAADDADQDGLSEDEESRFGTDPHLADTDGDGVPDGFHVACGLWEALEALPRTFHPQGYRLEHPLRGVIPCEVCGALVNMGHVDVINPRENLTLSLSYLTLHHLRQGGFGSTPQDRPNLHQLDIALRGDGTSHLIPWPEDADQDGLRDAEEDHFGLHPNWPDTDGDGWRDGATVARLLYRLVMKLPDTPQASRTYLIRHEANCLAPCPVCREEVNCGFVQIINPWAELSLDASYLQLHFLKHGGLATSETDRIDPIKLDVILRPAVLISSQGDQITLRWMGKAGRTYQVHTAPDPAGPWTPGPTFLGEDRELVYPEVPPPEATRRFYQIVAQ